MISMKIYITKILCVSRYNARHTGLWGFGNHIFTIRVGETGHLSLGQRKGKLTATKILIISLRERIEGVSAIYNWEQPILYACRIIVVLRMKATEYGYIRSHAEGKYDKLNFINSYCISALSSKRNTVKRVEQTKDVEWQVISIRGDGSNYGSLEGKGPVWVE